MEPSLSEFNPKAIPWQWEALRHIRTQDYSDSMTREYLLSGSVGSAKSLLLIHVALTHCLFYPGARFCLVRRRGPDMMSTVVPKLLAHMADFEEGEDYEFYRTARLIEFNNGSQIILKSWDDKHFTRMRSMELSAAGVEELTENEGRYETGYQELFARVGRVSHVQERFVLSATNPDSPSHWVYRRFIEAPTPYRKVFYSLTSDNPFLPAGYVEGIKQNFDAKMVQRMLYGQWVEIASERIYHAYEQDRNFIRQTYTVNPSHPIMLSWDFNIGHGKPLSVVAAQRIGDAYHFFSEAIIEGIRTEQSLIELENRGVINPTQTYVIHGDATGEARSTNSNWSNYDVIRNYFQSRGIRYVFAVPKKNPSLKDRHSIVNAHCRNASNQSRVFVYETCPVLNEGMMKTALKPGAGYIEDEKYYQHCTTALGYLIYSDSMRGNIKPLAPIRR